jgi:hypothetical protein
MQLMDYSLLIGVRRESFKVLDSNNSGGGVSDGGNGGLTPNASSTDLSKTGAERGTIARETELGSNSQSFVESLTPSIVQRTPSVAARAGAAAAGLGVGVGSSGPHGMGAIGSSSSSSSSSNKLLGRNNNSSPTPGGGGLVEDAFKRDPDGGMRASQVEGPGTYYIGIIDVLQEWNYTKKMERFLKTYIKRYDPDGISAIEPKAYSERFWRGVVLDTFESLDYDNEELLTWRGDEAPDPQHQRLGGEKAVVEEV